MRVCQIEILIAFVVFSFYDACAMMYHTPKLSWIVMGVTNTPGPLWSNRCKTNWLIQVYFMFIYKFSESDVQAWPFAVFGLIQSLAHVDPDIDIILESLISDENRLVYISMPTQLQQNMEL